MIRVIIDRYLLALLGLAAAAGVLLVAQPGQSDSAGASTTLAMPAAIGEWEAADGAPEDVLPTDPRALDALRRTYRHGRQTAWLSVSRYPGMNDPQSRPAVFDIVPQHGWISIGRDLLRVSLNGHPGRMATINRVVIRQPGKQLVILYWYRLAGHVVTGEYELRLRLFVNTLLAHPRPLFLVRIASDSREAAEALVGPVANAISSRDGDTY